MGFVLGQAVIWIWEHVFRQEVNGPGELLTAWFVVVGVIALIAYPFWHFALGY